MNKINERINFYWNNGVYLGYVYKEVDGFYTFVFCDGNHGTWNSYVLRTIADKMDELNKEWQNNIDDYFKGRT